MYLVAHLCPVRDAIGEVHRRIREVLRTVTLAEVFGRPPTAARRSA